MTKKIGEISLQKKKGSAADFMALSKACSSGEWVRWHYVKISLGMAYCLIYYGGYADHGGEEQRSHC